MSRQLFILNCRLSTLKRKSRLMSVYPHFAKIWNFWFISSLNIHATKFWTLIVPLSSQTGVRQCLKAHFVVTRGHAGLCWAGSLIHSLVQLNQPLASTSNVVINKYSKPASFLWTTNLSNMPPTINQTYQNLFSFYESRPHLPEDEISIRRAVAPRHLIVFIHQSFDKQCWGQG